MPRYATSKVRLAVLAVLAGAAVLVIAGPSHAAGVDTGQAPLQKAPGVWSLVMDNLDPVFFLIMALSIAGLTLIIKGFMENREAVLLPPRTTHTIREMISQRRFQELMEFTETDPSFVSKALNPALKRAPSFSSMKEAMETSVGEQTAEQFRQIEYLNIIGNLGPLLGLLGTVLGMIDAFSQVSAQGGQANPASVAGGISKALCHTLLGLMLAIPCLAAFGWLRTRVDRLTIRGAMIAEELLLMIKPSEARPAAVAAGAGIRPGPVPPFTAPPLGQRPAGNI
jgi:biopolymer transport protein ExbB